nr:MAG TPA: hypothetical protein [Bacteriophage sp.]
MFLFKGIAAGTVAGKYLKAVLNLLNHFFLAVSSNPRNCSAYS